MALLRIARLALPGLAALAASAAAAQPFAFVALGDMPYGPPEQAEPAYHALIAAINRAAPAFSVHVGDIKPGSTPCSDAAFQVQRANFARFDGAVVYTPGDNEWTDCHRQSNGRFDPAERLQALRRLFFTPGWSLGHRPLALDNQPQRMPAHGAYVENQRWMHHGVLFVTVHVVGSHNNLDRRRPQTLPEFQARERANIAWLHDSFAQARAQGARAVVLAMQANPLGFINLSGQVASDSGFAATVGQTLLPLARDAGVPVLLVHGDTHTFRFDTPFRLQGQRLDRLWRLEVPGRGPMRAVRVSVDPAQPQPFAVQLLAAD